MIPKKFRAYCESLWKEWLEGKLKSTPELEKRFLLDHVPEPYIQFLDEVINQSKKASRQTEPMYLLLTNPGGGRPEQHRDNIRKRRSVISPELSYDQISIELAAHYKMELQRERKRAATRNAAIDDLRSKLGRNCVIQFETIPFHSKSLPGKRKLAKLITEVPILTNYTAQLRVAIADLPVMAISAVDTSRSITAKSIEDSPWLAHQASVMGVRPKELEFTPLVGKNNVVSCALLVPRDRSNRKAFVLKMGSNDLPGEAGREIIVKKLKSWWDG